MIAITEKIIPNNLWSIKCPYSMIPKYITIHNTANKASALNEYNYAFVNANKNKQTGWHMAIDDKEAIQAIPFNKNAWHAGDGLLGKGNRESIGIEICYSTDYSTDKFYKAIENTVDVVKQLMEMYKIPIENIKMHRDWSGKKCPHRMIDENLWNNFINRLEEEKSKMIEEGFNIVSFKNQKIYLYKQKSGEDIGLLSTDNYLETKRIDHFDFNAQGNEITCIINASYFENRQNAYYGQVYGREQSFTKDERPDQREYLDLVVTNDNRLISGNFASWEWLKDSVKLGLSYACCVLKDGYATDEYSSAVGIGKYSNKNTQTLFMKDNERFYFAVVAGKLNGYECREFAKSIGATDCYMLDSGGSSQMLTDKNEGYVTGRKIPNGLVFYKKKNIVTNPKPVQPDTQGIKSIGIIKVHSVGLRVRETLKFSRDTLEPIGKILKTIRIGGFIELVDFVPGIQPDGYQWTKVLNKGSIAYCQYDSRVYSIKLK